MTTLLSRRRTQVILVCLAVFLAGCGASTPRETPESAPPTTSPSETATVSDVPDGPWFDLSNDSHLTFEMTDGERATVMRLESTSLDSQNVTLKASVEYPNGSVSTAEATGAVFAPGDLSLIGKLSSDNATRDTKLRGTLALTLGLLSYAGSLADDRDLAIGATWTPANETQTVSIVGRDEYGGVGCYVATMPYPTLGPNGTLTTCLTGTGMAPYVSIVGDYYRFEVVLTQNR